MLLRKSIQRLSLIHQKGKQILRYSSSGIPSIVTNSDEILSLKRQNMPNNSKEWRAFYDSSIGPEGGDGAIITDPTFFTIPLDDHGYNRGHAVFDTCNVMNGRAFRLNFHLDRLLTHIL